MTFTEKLRAITRGRNASDLARLAGLPISAISNYLSKGQTPRSDVGHRLAVALYVSTDWLFDDAQGMPPVKRGATPEPTAFSADDHARELIRLAADALDGPPLYAALAVVSAALAEHHAAASPDAAAHEQDGHAGIGDGRSRRPLAGFSPAPTTAIDFKGGAPAHGNGHGTDAANASSRTNRPGRPVGLAAPDDLSRADRGGPTSPLVGPPAGLAAPSSTADRGGPASSLAGPPAGLAVSSTTADRGGPTRSLVGPPAGLAVSNEGGGAC